NIVGFTCPERDSVAGEANFFLIDTAEEDPRRTAFLRVGAPSTTTSTGAEANFRSGFDVYDPATLFCRYSIISIDALPDPGTGGAPGGQQDFPCPEWTPGT